MPYSQSTLTVFVWLLLLPIMAEPTDRKVLRYERYNTVVEGAETDRNFLQDVSVLTKKHNSLLRAGSMIINKQQQQEVTEHQCQEIALNAELHRDACRPNSTDIEMPQSPQTFPADEAEVRKNRCPCGCANTRGENLNFCIDEAKLSFMGSSLALSLFFVRVVVATALTLVAVFGLFQLVTNLLGGEADLASCLQEPMCLFKRTSTLQNKKSNIGYSRVAAWLGVAACVVCIIISRYAKLRGNVIYETVDKAIETPSDRAIKIENLPFGDADEQELIEIIKYKEQTLQLNVHEDRQHIKLRAIHMVYNMKRPRKLLAEIEQQSKALEEHLQDLDGGLLKPGHETTYMNDKLKLIELVEELQDFRRRFMAEVQYRRSLSTTCCMIEFGNQQSRDKFLRRYGTKSMGILEQLRLRIMHCISSQGTTRIFFKGNLVKIERAPEPEDILWENCEERYSLMRLVLIWAITFLLILLSLGIVVGLEYLQVSLQKDPSWQKQGDSIVTVFNYLISISLMVVNKLLWVVLFYLIKIQFNHTTSEEVTSRVNKTIIAQSLNCIVVPILTNVVFQSRLYGSDGLTGQILDYSISNTLIPLVLLVLDPLHLLKVLALNIQCLRIRIVRHLWKQEAEVNQRNFDYVHKVNQLYEGSDFDITSSYVYLLAGLFHASFYCTLQPFLLVLAALGALAFYYIKKYLLLTRYTSPKMLNKLVFSNAISAISYMPLFYGTGSLVFLNYIYTPELKLVLPGGLAILLGIFNIVNPTGLVDRPINFFYKLATRKTVLKKGEQESNQTIKPQELKTTTQTIQKKANPQYFSQKRPSTKPLVQQQDEQGSTKDTPTTKDEEKFKRNVDYSYHNHISTLLGASKLLVDKPIDNKVRKEIRNFVNSFGDDRENMFDYPKEATSNVDLLSNVLPNSKPAVAHWSV